MTIKNNKLRPARLATLIAFAFTGISQELYASDSFNTALVELDNPGVGKADLSAFESGSQAPGTYHVDIILDDQLMDTRDIPFAMAKTADGSEALQPCLSIELLKQWGVKTDLFPQLAVEESDCANLQAIPQASADFLSSGRRRSVRWRTDGYRGGWSRRALLSGRR